MNESMTNASSNPAAGFLPHDTDESNTAAVGDHAHRVVVVGRSHPRRRQSVKSVSEGGQRLVLFAMSKSQVFRKYTIIVSQYDIIYRVIDLYNTIIKVNMIYTTNNHSSIVSTKGTERTRTAIRSNAMWMGDRHNCTLEITRMSALLASSFVGRVAAFKATKVQVRIS
jgi:hypothetical protein